MKVRKDQEAGSSPRKKDLEDEKVKVPARWKSGVASSPEEFGVQPGREDELKARQGDKSNTRQGQGGRQPVEH